MTFKSAITATQLKETLFSGDITYDTFMSEYLGKKSCVLGSEGGVFAGHSDGSDIGEILARSGRMDPALKKFKFNLPQGEDEITEMDLYTQETVIGLKRPNSRYLKDGNNVSYAPFLPSLKAHMVRRLFELGGSLRIIFADEFDKKIAKTMKGFEDAFQAKFGATIFYHALSNEKAATRHHCDIEDFFAMQMKGEKRWIVTQSMVNNARANFLQQLDTTERYDDLYNESKKQVVMDVVLKPGQVLYVPPLFGHSVHPLGDYEGEIMHVAFMMLSSSFDDFRDWKKKTVYQRYDAEMSRIDLEDIPKSLAQMSDLKWESSLSEIEEFRRFVEDNSYSNVSDGFMLQESVLDRVARNTDEAAYYCPIFGPRFVDNGDHISLSINTEEYQLEPDMANYFKVLLNHLFEHKYCKVMELVNLSELTDNAVTIETLQSLFDNGIINIA